MNRAFTLTALHSLLAPILIAGAGFGPALASADDSSLSGCYSISETQGPRSSHRSYVFCLEFATATPTYRAGGRSELLRFAYIDRYRDGPWTCRENPEYRTLTDSSESSLGIVLLTSDLTRVTLEGGPIQGQARMEFTKGRELVGVYFKNPPGQWRYPSMFERCGLLP